MNIRLAAILLSILIAPLVVAKEGEEVIKVTFSGEWEGKALDGSKVSLEFTHAGGVVWRVLAPNSEEHFLQVYRAKYKLVYADSRLNIDVSDFEGSNLAGLVFQGIVQILGADSFKMEGEITEKGKRPTVFSKDAVVFSSSDHNYAEQAVPPKSDRAGG